MTIAHKVVDSSSSLAHLHGNCIPEKESEDAASECSTVSDLQDSDVRCKYCEDEDEVEALLIFDWDDTLLPTSWLQQRGLHFGEANLNGEDKNHLARLAESVRSTLRQALQFGEVVIVTNAEQGWVEMTCAEFMPSLVNLLQEVRVISARTEFEKMGRAVSDWKHLAFAKEIERFYGSKGASHQRNVVSLGDSLHELAALKSVAASVPNCLGKSIKLFDSPSIEQLIEQHGLLGECLLDVVEYNGEVDVEIGVENSA